MQSKNYYQILGISRNASPEEISAAKNALAKKYHPDATAKDGVDTTDQMACILEAYAVLSDPGKRADYDRGLSGRNSVMQTYDLHETANEPEDESDPVIACWRAANSLYDIVTESVPLLRQKHHPDEDRLASLTIRALEQICVLRDAQVPKQYWYPDTMNRLLLSHMKNRNYSLSYLLTLYDAHEKAETSSAKRRQQKKTTDRYLKDLDRLLSH